jgi:hypothetical protein
MPADKQRQSADEKCYDNCYETLLAAGGTYRRPAKNTEQTSKDNQQTRNVNLLAAG